jgi:hypothetical protein
VKVATSGLLDNRHDSDNVSEADSKFHYQHQQQAKDQETAFRWEQETQTPREWVNEQDAVCSSQTRVSEGSSSAPSLTSSANMTPTRQTSENRAMNNRLSVDYDQKSRNGWIYIGQTRLGEDTVF